VLACKVPHFEWQAPARAGGYHAEARMVAQVSGWHAKTVDICLHHVGGAAGGREALAYIKNLPRGEQEALLMRHGKTLVSKYGLEMQACAAPVCCGSTKLEVPGLEGDVRHGGLYCLAARLRGQLVAFGDFHSPRGGAPQVAGVWDSPPRSCACLAA
jgi:hypothetical protein